MRLINYFGDTKFIKLNTGARLPWTSFKFYPARPNEGTPRLRTTYTHIIWGRFSLMFGGYSCLECRDTGETSKGDGCQNCCEHGEYDHGICYGCGKDCLDDLVGAAEAACEGDR